MRQNGLRHIALSILILVLVDPAVAAMEVPTAASPGAARKLVLVEDRCPTFHWGAVAGAASYELVVYRFDQRGDGVRPVLRRHFMGAVTGWTPALEECLERGGRYAWSVRAAKGEKASGWSAPSLFQVAAGPSRGELEAALVSLRRVLGQDAAGASSVEVTGGDLLPHAAYAAQAPTPSTGESETLLSVDGNVTASSFNGDGAMITNLAPANLSTAVPLSKGGTGATTAALARTNLEVAQGPHIADTSAATICGTGELLDGDGGCVEKTGLNDLPGCAVGDVPTFSAAGWSCAPPVTIVSSDVVWAGGNRYQGYVACPTSAPNLVTGGIGGSGCALMVGLVTEVLSLPFSQDVTCLIEELNPGSDHLEECDCVAVCR